MSLEPTWWESLIPIYGSVYSTANNFSKGNIWAGTFDAVLAVVGGTASSGIATQPRVLSKTIAWHGLTWWRPHRPFVDHASF